MKTDKNGKFILYKVSDLGITLKTVDTVEEAEDLLGPTTEEAYFDDLSIAMIFAIECLSDRVKELEKKK